MMPRSTSIVKNDQTLVPERFFQLSPSHVSTPGSPARGTVWNDQSSFPVRASQPRMSPYRPELGACSPLLPPVITTFLKIAGGDARLKPPSTSPRTLAFRSTVPSSPNPAAGLPRSASTASSRSPAPLNRRGGGFRHPRA